MLDSFQVRSLDAQWSSKIDDLHSLAYHGGMPPGYWKAYRESTAFYGRVALDNRTNEPIGFISYRHLGNVVFVDRLVVHPRFRRCGVGRCLLSEPLLFIGAMAQCVCIRERYGAAPFLKACGFTRLSRGQWICREDLVNV